MPQIWATYGELSLVIGGGVDDVRDEVRRTGLPRRRCSDGLTRVKLPLDLGLRVLAATLGTPSPSVRAAGSLTTLVSGPLAERVERLERILLAPAGGEVEPRRDATDQPSRVVPESAPAAGLRRGAA